MKKTLLLAAAIAYSSLSAQTPPAQPASSYSITADLPYVTSYVFRGMKYAEESLQPSVKLTYGNFYAGVWSNAPLDRGYELEIDYFAGYTFKLGEKWGIDAGATLYSYPGLDTPGADKTTFEGYVGLTGTVGIINSGTYLYYDTTLETFTAQQTIGYTHIVNDKLSLTLLGTIGHVAPDTGTTYTYWSFGIALPYKLTDRLTLTAGAQYVATDMHAVDDRTFVGTLGATFTF